MVKTALWRAALRLGVCLTMAAPALAAQGRDWHAQVMKLIAANFSYPRSAQLRGEEGTARIRITINASGRLASIELVQPSGSAILDREAVRIPAKVGSFPPPPGRATVSLVVPISFRLK